MAPRRVRHAAGGRRREALLAWLMSDDYLQPKIDGDIDDAGPTSAAWCSASSRGTRFTAVRLAFEGARGIDPKVLDDIINEQDLERQLFTDPLQVTTLLERYYREQGYLTTEIDKPVYEFEGTVARVVLAVREGPRFFVRNVSTSGNAVLPASALLQICRSPAAIRFCRSRPRTRSSASAICTGSAATTTCGPTTSWLSIARPAAST